MLRQQRATEANEHDKQTKLGKKKREADNWFDAVVTRATSCTLFQLWKTAPPATLNRGSQSDMMRHARTEVH